MRIAVIILLVILSRADWPLYQRVLDDMCGEPVEITREAVTYDCNMILPDEPDIVDEV